ncbi:MAG: DUF4347 domain-containing protein, partial [Burkholderiales bacterium]
MAEILFVDQRVRGIETLLSRIDADVQVVLLAETADGIEQIAAALQSVSGLQTIHILSHGAAGTLLLGATQLNSDNIDAYRSQLVQIGAALSEKGDLLLYGCDVAQGTQGRAFIETLAKYTGADVAASNNLTGLGGDWRLEETTGEVESLAIDGTGYAATLAVVNGTSASESLTGTASADTLTGLAGNDTLDGGAGTDIASFAGPMTGYSFATNANNQITVTDTNTSNGDEGTDTLLNIEQASFADGTLNLRAYGETRVNTTTSSDQQAPAVTVLSGGGYVVVWMSSGQDGSGNGIYAQRYDASGAAVGVETRINSTTANDQEHPALVALKDGGYLAMWYSNNQDGSFWGVYAQRYDANGAAVGGETRINNTTADYQGIARAAALSDGGYVVSWQSLNQDGDSWGVYSQRYNSNGAAVGGETRISTTTAGEQGGLAIAALSDGGYVATWTSYGQDGGVGLGGIYAQRYDANGAAVGGETRINTTTANSQQYSAICVLSDGGYVATWTSYDAAGINGDIYSQRFDSSGAAIGAETRINTTTADNQYNVAIAALSDGGYVVTWSSGSQDGSGFGIYAQRYSANGLAIGVETRINSSTANAQEWSDIAPLSDGGYVVTWHSNLQDGSGYGIYSQRYDASGNVYKLSGDVSANTLTWTGSIGIVLDGGGGGGGDTRTGGAGTD